MFVVRTHRPAHGKRLIFLLLAIACGVAASALSSTSRVAVSALSSASRLVASAPSAVEAKIACEREGKIYLLDADGSDEVQLPTPGFVARDPAWSPDGARLAFQCGGEPADICVMDADGQNLSRLTGDGHSREPAWSPDGARLAYSYCDAEDPATRLYVMDADGGNPRRVRLADASIKAERSPSWSPDGRRLAFFRHTLEVVSDAPGRTVTQGIHVAGADGSGLKRLRTPGGRNPAWRPNGSKP